MDDIFKKKLPVYTFEYICKEDGSTRLNDRAFKHFFIAETCAKMIEDREARSFFEFLISNKTSDNYTSDLDKYVTDAKHNMQWRVQYMTWERQQAYAFQEGQEEGIAIGEERGKREKAIETAKKMLESGKLSLEDISTFTSLSIEEIQKLTSA